MSRFRKALELFWNQTTTHGKEKIKTAGQDHLGNKYFEVYRPHGGERKIHRYFEKPNVDNFDSLVDAAHVPPCWDAWLRFRRQVPPTQQEVEDSEEYYRVQQKMAAERKKKELEEREKKAASKEQEKSSIAFSDTNQARTVPPGYYDKMKC